MSPRISVITPSYQRAGTLARLHESLLAQTFTDFEWVVVDDGSTDGTEAMLAAWARDAPFPIRCRWQENAGKHAAVNRGVELSKAQFCALMDSDDWYTPEALERMLFHWDSIPIESRDEFATVEGLCADPRGGVIGDRFPAQVFDSNTFETAFAEGITGDKIGMYRRDVLAEHPFPEDLGWHVTPALVWNRIAARWSSRSVNEVWAHKEYLSEGLSDRETELRLRFSRAQLIFWREFAAMPRRMPLRVRSRANANYLRYSLLCGVGLRRALRRAPKLGWALLALAPGLLLYRRDRSRLAANPEIEIEDHSR
ncbi:MAG: glycosyltransferase [Solirubrobacterales bacterium]|nr:glycosyltransferase [Solirubrobacterales bacterium]